MLGSRFVMLEKTENKCLHFAFCCDIMKKNEGGYYAADIG